MEVFEIGQYAASVMDRINEDFGDDADIRTISLAIEVDMGDATTILVSCDDDRPWVQIAFLEEALATLEDRRDAMRGAMDDGDYSDPSD
jgi:hypothetical protein